MDEGSSCGAQSCGFVLTSMIMNHSYEGMKWSLTLIDSLHLLGVLLIQGVVTGLFG